MGKDFFPEMLGAVHNHMVANPDLSVNGWKATGLWPFNTKAVDDKIIGRPNRVRKIPQHKIPYLEAHHLKAMRDFWKKYVIEVTRSHKQQNKPERRRV